MSRPRVDVVVPFRGTVERLRELRTRLARLHLEPGDTLLVVDNTPGRHAHTCAEAAAVPVLHAAERATPGFARNLGAAQGSAEWILFIDADATPCEELLDRYFDPSPAPSAGLLAGGVRDEPVQAGGPAAARYAYLQDAMSQRQTFRLQEWAFAQMANAACRREAFEAIGGFRDDIRAGEDADLCYRLSRGGWEIERREQAWVVHHNRETVSGFVWQKLLHGAAAAWLDSAYPGSFPARRRPGLVWWAVRRTVNGVASAARRRDRERALLAVFDAIEQLSFEFGRSLPNERPLHARRRG